MTKKMLVDLTRCIGCWTCAMGCKMCHNLPDDEFRITVRTHGSGAGIDRPQGVYPNLRMTWQPIYTTSCNWCVERQAEDDGPMCVDVCPTKALAYGEADDPDSAFSHELARCAGRHYHVFELPAFEGSRKNVVYAVRE